MDEICDRFDGAWKDGLRTRVEEYLGAESEPGRSVLLHELLAAESRWRRRLGEQPQREEYLERLAAHSSLVDAAFEGNGTAPGSTVDRDARVSASPVHPEVTSERRFRILRRHAEG